MQVDSNYSIFARNDSLFLVDASPVSGINLKDLEKEIESILYSYKKSMVTKRDLDKILAQVIAYEVYQQDSLFLSSLRIWYDLDYCWQYRHYKKIY